MDRVFSLEGTIKQVEFITSKIGEEWLLEQLQTIDSYKPKHPSKLSFIGYAETHFHPLALLIYQVNWQLRNAVENKFFEVTEDILRLTFLSENIYFLSLNNTTNLDKKVKELMSSDKQMYDKTYYEIQVAAKYSNLGYQIEFVETQSDAGLKTPDLLVSESVEVECKKKNVHSKRDSKNINMWLEIMRNASTLMDKFKYNYIVCTKTLKDPQPSDVQFIIRRLKDLIKDKSEGSFSYQEKGISIHLTFASLANQEFLANQFQVNLGEELDYAAPAMEVMATDKRTIKIRNPRFFAFKSEIIPDRIQSVIESIKDATLQLTGTKPGLIYVNLNQLDNKFVQTDFDRLERLVRDRLRQNSTITAVILTSEGFQKEETGIKYFHKARVIKNDNSKFTLPTNFTIIGDNQ
jgi:hypothetical protein